MRLRHAALALMGLYPLTVQDVFAQTQQPTTGGTYVQGTVPYGCYLTQGTSIVYVPCTTSGASFIPSASGGGGGGSSGVVLQGTTPWVDTLASGANPIGSVTVSGFVGLASGANAIGSVTVSGSVSLASGANAIGAVTQSGIWVDTLASGANPIGSVTVSGFVGLASGANAIGSVTVSGSVSLASGANAIGAVTQSGIWTAYTTPTTGAFTSPGAIVGTGVAVALASGLYHHVQLQNLSSGATVACSWTTSGSLTSASGFQLVAGQSALWGPTTAGVPSGALLCIASATGVPLYIETN
jgi:hypothetical protein